MKKWMTKVINIILVLIAIFLVNSMIAETMIYSLSRMLMVCHTVPTGGHICSFEPVFPKAQEVDDGSSDD